MGLMGGPGANAMGMGYGGGMGGYGGGPGNPMQAGRFHNPSTSRLWLVVCSVVLLLRVQDVRVVFSSIKSTTSSIILRSRIGNINAISGRVDDDAIFLGSFCERSSASELHDAAGSSSTERWIRWGWVRWTRRS